VCGKKISSKVAFTLTSEKYATRSGSLKRRRRRRLCDPQSSYENRRRPFRNVHDRKNMHEFLGRAKKKKPRPPKSVSFTNVLGVVDRKRMSDVSTVPRCLRNVVAKTRGRISNCKTIAARHTFYARA